MCYVEDSPSVLLILNIDYLLFYFFTLVLFELIWSTGIQVICRLLGINA